MNNNNNNNNGPSARDVEKLSQWARVAHSRRGLEKMSLPEISQLRKECRLSVVRSVLETQSRPDFSSAEERFQTIRIQCERRTRAARLFAQVLGQADAAAAEGEYGPQRPQRPQRPQQQAQPQPQAPPPKPNSPLQSQQQPSRQEETEQQEGFEDEKVQRRRALLRARYGHLMTNTTNSSSSNISNNSSSSLNCSSLKETGDSPTPRKTLPGAPCPPFLSSPCPLSGRSTATTITTTTTATTKPDYYDDDDVGGEPNGSGIANDQNNSISKPPDRSGAACING